MLEDRVGDAQVAFGVLEIDRVDLVRHGGRADLAGHGLLLEVAEGDVAPHVAVEIDEDGVEARDGVEQLGDVVVRLDLGGIGVPGQAQVLLDEFAGVGFPVHVRIGGQVGVVVAHGTVDLAEQRHGGHLGNLALQAIDDVGHFLAQGGGRCRLAVGARQHRHVGELNRQFADRLGGLAHQRQQHAVTALAQHQRVGQVVDVLAGAGEVDEFVDGSQLRQLLGLLLEQVFHGLHVVVGGALEFLDALGVLQLEVLGQAVQQRIGFGGEGRHFRNAGMLGQALQPAHFYQDAVLDQAELAEDRAQSVCLAGVTAIDGGNRGERGELHGVISAIGQKKQGA